MKKDKPIRVAHIIGKMCAGGVETVVFNYYREIDKKEIQFDFYYHDDSTIEPPKELLAMGARFIEIPSYKKIWKYIPVLIKNFKQEKYQIVHSHMNTLSVFPLMSAWVAKVPIRIAHNHSVPGKDNILINLLKQTLKLFSKCFATDYFACSEKAGRWLFGDKEYDKGNVRIIRNALDFDRFLVPTEERSKLLKELQIENKFIVGHVGRFTYAKNHMFLLEVFKWLSTKKEDAILLLVGDGELKDKIVEKIRELGIENKVVFTGATSNPEKYYALMNVVILPSHFEGLSMTTIESQVCGVPILVSEAVPDETNISTGWQQMSLNAGIEAWGQASLVLAEKEVSLIKKSEMYNIEKETKELSKWYFNRSGKWSKG